MEERLSAENRLHGNFYRRDDEMKMEALWGQSKERLISVERFNRDFDLNRSQKS